MPARQRGPLPLRSEILASPHPAGHSEELINASLRRKTSILMCPSCGALLSVSPDIERFACKHCAAEQAVVRQGETTALKCVAETI